MHPTELGNLEFERLKSTDSMAESGDVIAKTWDLAKTRNRFVWPLLVISLAIYFGLLVLVLSSPDAMSLARRSPRDAQQPDLELRAP